MIRELVAACIDDESTLRSESARSKGRARAMLDRLAQERSGSVERLSRLEGRSGPRSRAASPAAWLREGGRRFRSLLGGEHRGDCIAACRRSSRRTDELFDQALELPLAPTLRAAVSEERSHVEAAYAELVASQYAS